jgi:hypothetical protein
VSRVRVPFGEAEAGSEPDAFDPGPVLAQIQAEGLVPSDPDKRTVEGSVSSPWGSLSAERRGEDEVLVSTPNADVVADQVMLNAAAMKLGIERDLVDETGASIKEVDVGQRVLVVPYPDERSIVNAPEQADPSGVPGVEAGAGVVYALTQSRPYVKIVARSWGEVAPMTGIAAAALHLVTSKSFRPSYPRTRVVGRYVGDATEEVCEITVQARNAGDGAVVEHVFVGGRVGDA